MNKLSVLRTALLDLLWELQGSGVSLIIGGGYGIFLKAEYIRDHGIRTLITELPETRSTNDLDIFLRPELLIAQRINNDRYRKEASKIIARIIMSCRRANCH